MSPTRRTFLLGCLCGGVLTIVLSAGGFVISVFLFREAYIAYQKGQLRPPPVPFGLKADYAWKVQDIEGKEVEMASFQGKPLFLHFWHPECTVCAAETEALNRLWERIGTAGVAMACVTWCEAQELKDAVQQRDIRFPVYRMQGARPAVFQGKNTPATYIIAPNGDIVFKHSGGAQWDTEEAANFLLQWNNPLPNSAPQNM